MSTDILYYLKANGAQFSEEMRKTFGDAERQAADAAKQMKANFESGFNQVQELAKKALAMPRLDGGALNLGSSAADARQAAAAFTEQANALNQIVLAAERVAIKEGDASEATRLWIQGARAAKLEAEKQAASLNQQASSLERLQAELGITASQQTVVTQRSGAQRAAMQQLTFQLGDIAQGFAAGISPMTIFIQQGGQVVQAIGLMAGEAKGFLGFLGGPWGQVITVAAVLLTPLISKLLQTGDAADQAATKMKNFLSVEGVSVLQKAAFDKLKELNQAKDQLAEIMSSASGGRALTLSLLSGQKPGSFDSVLSSLGSPNGVFSGQGGGGFLSLASSLLGKSGSGGAGGSDEFSMLGQLTGSGVGAGTFGSGPQAGGVLGLGGGASGASGALAGIGSVLGVGLQGAAIGAITGRGSGGALGGAIGGIIGKQLGKEVLGKALGSWAGPVGEIAGSINERAVRRNDGFRIVDRGNRLAGRSLDFVESAEKAVRRSVELALDVEEALRCRLIGLLIDRLPAVDLVEEWLQRGTRRTFLIAQCQWRA